MAVKRFVIGNGPEKFQPDDRVVTTNPDPEDPSRTLVTVERDVPDAPDYYAGVVGTAMIQNEYMVEHEHHGVWIERATGLLFMAFKTKKNQRGLWAEKHVTNFVPDPSPMEQVAALSGDLDKARKELRQAKRKQASAESALQELVRDIRFIQGCVQAGNWEHLNQWSMATSAGANLLDWIRRTFS